MKLFLVSVLIGLFSALPSQNFAFLPSDTVFTVSTAHGEARLTLPSTYFVAIISEDDTKYNVSYLDLNGTVAKSDVNRVDYEPVTKYANATLTPASDGMPIKVRALPNKDAPTLGTLEDGENAAYYGTATGEELMPGLGTQWYCIRYSSQTSKIGYVYARHVAAQSIEANVVEQVPVPNPNPDIIPGEDGYSTALQTVLIVSLCIPAVAVMFLLFRRPKKQHKPRQWDD